MSEATRSSVPVWQVPLQQGVLRIGGPDASSFLHGQFVSHVLRMQAGEVVRSAWCTPQGRVSFLFWLLRRQDDYLIVLPETELSRISQRLRLFVLRAKVEIEPLTPWRVVGLRAAPDAALPGTAGHWQESSPGVVVFRPGNCERWICLAPLAAFEAWAVPRSLATASSLDWLACDVEDGIVEISGASVNEFLPQQLNLDQSGSVAFDKGCYPGQEIIARLKYRGQVKSRLLRGTCQISIPPGTRLAPSPEAPTGGTVLTCAPASSSGYVLLAVVDLGASGTPLGPVDAPDTLIHFAELPTATP
jgi:folate-binding protein YgfZ